MVIFLSIKPILVNFLDKLRKIMYNNTREVNIIYFLLSKEFGEFSFIYANLRKLENF